MQRKYWANFLIALEAVLTNKIRSLLTALGIIFGVAAVIAMLAIGAGAQKEILEQIKLVGVNNIIVEPIIEQKEDVLKETSGQNEKQKYSPGITVRDLKAIQAIVPGVKAISPEIQIDTYIIKNGIRRSAKLIGVEPSYFELTNFNLVEGRMFNATQLKKGTPVCIIGKSVKSKFFPTEDALGKSIKVGKHWLKVVGVLEERVVSNSNLKKLGIRDINMDVYTPLQTVLVRYENRDLLTESMIRSANKGGRGMVFIVGGDDEEQGADNKNIHQLDRLVIQVEETEMLTSVAEVVSRMLKRRHNDVIDYEIQIPELLLEQQRKSKEIFNYVLFVIAAISLVVGGIGIMNIMLASVMERIKEIGLRLAIGAQKTDVVMQFLFEAVLISVSGGIVGVVLGITMAEVISKFTEIPTVITFLSILVSFGVAATIGLIFGIAPARKAASQDPITSLRYE